MRRSRLVVLSLIFTVVGGGCYKFTGYPPSGKAIHLAIVVSAARGQTQGKYTTTTFPQFQPVRRNDDLVWDIVDPCNAGVKVAVQFRDPTVVEVDNSEAGQKKGKVKGQLAGRYKYSILIEGVVVEDPEIEIWP
jgi:hypothetical protein